MGKEEFSMEISAKLSGIFEFVSKILGYIFDFFKSLTKKDETDTSEAV